MPSQHYEFAHRALPAIAFHMPGEVLGVLSSDQAEKALQDLWNQAGKHVGTESSVEIGYSLYQIEQARILAAILRLPEPQSPTEAILVAIVGFHEDSASPFDHVVAMRYFTLESTGGLDLGTPYYFCEWTSDCKHLNHGPGPEPTEESFLAFIFEVLAAKEPSGERQVGAEPGTDDPQEKSHPQEKRG